MEAIGYIIGFVILIYLAKHLPLLQWVLIILGLVWLFGTL